MSFCFSVWFVMRMTHYTMPTHTEGRSALTHVLSNVFEIGVDHPLTLSLAQCGYCHITDIIGTSFVDIEALVYEDDHGKVIDLPKLHQFPLQIFQQYLHHRNAWGRPICGDWKSIIAQDFNAFAERLGFVPEDFHGKGKELVSLTLPNVTPKPIVLSNVTPKLIVPPNVTQKLIVHTNALDGPLTVPSHGAEWNVVPMVKFLPSSKQPPIALADRVVEAGTQLRRNHL